MRDISNELKERLAGYRTERKQLSARLERLDMLEKLTTELLGEEERKATVRQRSLFAPVVKRPEYTTSGLADLILSLLSESIPTEQDRLMNEVIAKEFDFGGKSPARSVNAALLGLRINKRVERMGKKMWRLTKEDTANAIASG